MTLPAVDPKNDDPNTKVQRQMAYFLPLISILYGGMLPAGLFLYWITATIIQIVQQYLILGWGGMFPLFGWYPEFARNHTPRFPVKMPEPKPDRPQSTTARRSARKPSTETSRPSRRSGPTERGAADEGDDADHERIPGVHRQVRRGGHQGRLRRVRRRARRPRLRDPHARLAAACWAWAPSPPGSSPRRAARSAARRPSARPPRRPRCPPRAREEDRPSDGDRPPRRDYGDRGPRRDDRGPPAPPRQRRRRPPARERRPPRRRPRPRRDDRRPAATTARPRRDDRAAPPGHDPQLRAVRRRGRRRDDGPRLARHGARRARGRGGHARGARRRQGDPRDAHGPPRLRGRHRRDPRGRDEPPQRRRRGRRPGGPRVAHRPQGRAPVGAPAPRQPHALPPHRASGRACSWTSRTTAAGASASCADLAARAAERVAETGKMLQLEPMPALERRWVHLALRDNDSVATQSIGEEPNRRVVVLPRNPLDPARHRRGGGHRPSVDGGWRARAHAHERARASAPASRPAATIRHRPRDRSMTTAQPDTPPPVPQARPAAPVRDRVPRSGRARRRRRRRRAVRLRPAVHGQGPARRQRRRDATCRASRPPRRRTRSARPYGAAERGRHHAPRAPRASSPSGTARSAGGRTSPAWSQAALAAGRAARPSPTSSAPRRRRSAACQLSPAVTYDAEPARGGRRRPSRRPSTGHPSTRPSSPRRASSSSPTPWTAGRSTRRRSLAAIDAPAREARHARPRSRPRSPTRRRRRRSRPPTPRRRGRPPSGWPRTSCSSAATGRGRSRARSSASCSRSRRRPTARSLPSSTRTASRRCSSTMGTALNKTATNATFRLKSGRVVVVQGQQGRPRGSTRRPRRQAILDTLMAAPGRPGGRRRSRRSSSPRRPRSRRPRPRRSRRRCSEISRWTTYFPIWDRNGFGANIWIPASIINGYVVGPGETFDFWDAVGPVTRANGLQGRRRDHQRQDRAAGRARRRDLLLLHDAVQRRAPGRLRDGRPAQPLLLHRSLPDRASTRRCSSRLGGSTQTMTWTNDTKYPVLIRGINTRSGGRGYVTFVLYSVPNRRKVVIGKPDRSRTSARRRTRPVLESSRPGCAGADRDPARRHGRLADGHRLRGRQGPPPADLLLALRRRDGRRPVPGRATLSDLPADPAAPRWWQTGVVYQVYPRSFRDTDGDGVGDLPGVIERLDHLALLGVDAVWLSPIFRSPMRDYGYDVADYLDIDPLFGTLADADRLIAEAHAPRPARPPGLRPQPHLVGPPVVPRTPARRATPRTGTGMCGATRRPTAGRPTTWRPVRRPGVDARRGDRPVLVPLVPAGAARARLAEPRACATAMLDVLRFWFARGVDGFRIDVLWMIAKDDAPWQDAPVGHGPAGRPATRATRSSTATARTMEALLAELRDVADEFPDRVLVGEVYLPPERLVPLLRRATGRGAHLPFNFALVSRCRGTPPAIRRRDRARYEARAPGRRAGRTGCWATTTSRASRAASARRRRASRRCCC